MEVSICFLRHGQTDHNKKHIFYGHTDVPLNSKGYKEAVKAAGVLRQTHFDAVYSSPLLRAKNTAEIVMGKNKYPLEIIYTEGLKEICFGKWEGMKPDDIETAYTAEWNCYMSDFYGFTFPGGESITAYNDRIKDFMQGLIKKHSDGNILIVSHKGFILSAISYLLHGESKHLFKYDIDTGKTAMLECNGEYHVLRWLNR